jgi:hypothetical protein
MDHIGRDLAALKRLSVTQLQARHAELFGETTTARHKTWLIKRLAWRLQALAEGDLSERARQRAAELARDADLRLQPPQPTTAAALPRDSHAPNGRASANHRLPPPGTILTRPYKGQILQVHVLEQGFAFNGQVYRSLSAVAKAITGAHYNGYLFFRLNQGVSR